MPAANVLQSRIKYNLFVQHLSQIYIVFWSVYFILIILLNIMFYLHMFFFRH